MAQSQTVGLVLSGGGSKGLSHIGVIKALEENNIPIDYITGTSMGAIIGGMYASGYSINEIEEIIKSDKFESWTSGELDEEYMYYFKNSTQDASWVNFDFDYDRVKGKIESSISGNLIEPHHMDFSLLEIFSAPSAVSNYDFNQLFVPFRCVASDIDASVPVIFSEGQLGQAIRASATYPLYFKPITVDGRLLFDGGIYNNFPLDIMESHFNPDIIIGSKAVSNYESANAEDIISQLQNMIVSRTDYNIPENGILIEPDLPEKVNVLDFSNKLRFIDSGYYAALGKMDEIREHVQRKSDSSEINEKRRIFKEKFSPLIVDTVIIRGLKNENQEKYIRSAITQRAQHISLSKLKSEYFKLLGDNKIKSIFPMLVYDTVQGFYELYLDIERDDSFTVGIGGNISSKAISGAFLGLQYRYLGRIGFDMTANGYFGQFYSSAFVQPRIDITGRFPFYLAANYTYNHKDYFRSSVYFFEDKQPSYLIQNETHVGIDIGFPAASNGKVTNGYSTGYTKDEYYQDNTFTRLDTTDRTYFNFFEGHIDFEVNSLNDKQFPSRGVLLLLRLRYLSGDEKTIPGSTSSSDQEINAYHKWMTFQLVYDNYFKRVGPVTFGFYGELLLSNQTLFSNYTATILRTPAFEPIPEMETLFLPNYRAQNFAGLGLKTNFNIYKHLNLRVEGYLFQPYEELAADENGNAVRKKELSFRSYVASATIVYHTPIAPISISFNYYDRAEENFSILFNIGFLLFNRDVTQ